jgi:Mg2+ and Co2+ transporter CorA
MQIEIDERLSADIQRLFEAQKEKLGYFDTVDALVHALLDHAIDSLYDVIESIKVHEERETEE